MRVAAIQLTAGPDHDANRVQGMSAIRSAAALGVELVVLPEKWLAIGGTAALRPAAQRLVGARGPVVTELAALATELQVDLIAGSLPEAPRPDDADQRLWNTSLHVRRDGTVAAAYRKIHLFDADINGVPYRESHAERPGAQPVVTTLTGGVRAGLTVCFDLRFPALYGALAAAQVALITVPAAFTLATTRAHWELLVRARAVETGAFVVAANQAGTHADGTSSGGQSLIVSPWGEVLARAPETGDATLTASLDFASVTQARAALPLATLARHDAYGVPPTDGVVPDTDPAAGYLPVSRTGVGPGASD
jgi:predicted amidohydrolase